MGGCEIFEAQLAASHGRRTRKQAIWGGGRVHYGVTTARKQNVNRKKNKIFGLSVKVSVIITTLGKGGTTSRVNERRESENSTNDNRVLQVWGARQT